MSDPINNERVKLASRLATNLGIGLLLARRPRSAGPVPVIVTISDKTRKRVRRSSSQLRPHWTN